MAPKIIRSALNPGGVTDEQNEEAAVQASKQLAAELDRLLEFEPFVKFWTKFGEGVKEQARIALDPGADKKARNKAVHLHASLKGWYEWPMKQRAAALARIGATDQRERQRTQADPPTP